MLFLPIESAYLENHLGFEFVYGAGVLPPGQGSPRPVVVVGSGLVPLPTRYAVNQRVGLAIDGQIVLADQVQLGLAVPFFLSGWDNAGGSLRGGTELGNVVLQVKPTIFRSVGRDLTLAGYLNAMLPTATAAGPVGTIDYGFALTSRRYDPVTLGASLGGLWASDGLPISEVSAPDGWVHLDLFGSVALRSVASIQFGLQTAFPVHPDLAKPLLSLQVGTRFFVGSKLHLEVGARIALNEAAGVYNMGTRAAALVAFAYAP
jgi:hypothetical protein